MDSKWNDNLIIFERLIYSNMSQIQTLNIILCLLQIWRFDYFIVMNRWEYLNGICGKIIVFRLLESCYLTGRLHPLCSRSLIHQPRLTPSCRSGRSATSPPLTSSFTLTPSSSVCLLRLLELASLRFFGFALFSVDFVPWWRLRVTSIIRDAERLRNPSWRLKDARRW